jgi:hypothetical protein
VNVKAEQINKKHTTLHAKAVAAIAPFNPVITTAPLFKRHRGS